MIPPFPYPTLISPPFPLPVLIKETMQHMPMSGPPAIIFEEEDVILEGSNLITTKKTQLLESGGRSSVFMDHTEMYSHAHSTFKDLFGIDANVNFISYLSADKAYSSFLITHDDFITNSSRGRCLKLSLFLHSDLLENSDEILKKIKKEENLRRNFPGCVITADNNPSASSIKLEITLPPGIYPVIASQNPRGHEEIPKFYLLFASHYDVKFSLLEDNKIPNAWYDQVNKVGQPRDKGNIHIDERVNLNHGYYPLYGFSSFNIKSTYTKTYDPSTTDFNIELNTKLYSKFFEAIIDLLILANMSNVIEITQFEFRAFLSDFYVKGNLVTSVKTNNVLREYLEKLYETAKNYIYPISDPKMSSYIDFFIKGNLIDLNQLYSDNPEQVFDKHILLDKDSYSSFKRKEKIPKFLNGLVTTPLFNEYRIDQAKALTALNAAGYPF